VDPFASLAGKIWNFWDRLGAADAQRLSNLTVAMMLIARHVSPTHPGMTASAPP
jgi:hypothetical protein